MRKHPFRLWRYRVLIPVPRDAEIISLNEGDTPLIRLKRIEKLVGVKSIYAKFEGANPTGSFKDRGMTVAVTMAKYLGFRNVICASTGNTASSMAAYAARGGLHAIIVLPEGKVARGKIAQSILHGATIIYVKGGFDSALKTVLAAYEVGLAYPLNSINPWRIEGQKTVAYEIVDEIGELDWIIVPVGNAGNITAIWKGLKELRKFDLIDRLPRLAGVQASGASPLVEAFRENREELKPVEKPETIASAIRIGNPVNWRRALRAVGESNGVLLSVSDEEILAAQRKLARFEGIGVEPASAVTLAGFLKLVEEKIIERDDKVVFILTGHALKDPDIASFHNIRSFPANNRIEALKIIASLEGTSTFTN